MMNPSVLGQYSLFHGLEQKEINDILPLMDYEVFDVGTEIIVEGSRNDKLRFILEGQVSVEKGGVVLTKLGEGDVFGEMEVLDIMPAESSVKTLTTTRTIALSIDALGDIYEDNLKIYSFLITNLAKDLSRRLRHMNRVIKESPPTEWS